ncbi:MAG: thymidine phosphorylase [Thermovirgaceae bacterium]
MFEMLPFLESKREGLETPAETMEAFVKACNDGTVPDYQISAWLMAVYFRGLSPGELKAFTLALAHSGKTVRFPDGMLPVDKHSTGGVGDKTTLVVVPLAAACGASVAKLSGKGLGFTGGTVDKLSAIPGMKTELSVRAFVEQVTTSGCAVSGHSADLAPAEAKFYTLRDVTATVPSIPLIASSIVSKKIAGGAKRFVFDVKSGSGAFMEARETALKLAGQLVELSRTLGFDAVALLTNMDQPLGRWVGNAAEVNEAIQVLNGKGPEDTSRLCTEIAGAMLFAAGSARTQEAGKEAALKALAKGKGIEKFREMIERQGGKLDDDVLDGKKQLPLGRHIFEIKAKETGRIISCHARKIGEALRLAGGGRLRKEDRLDLSAAIEILKKTGDQVEEGQLLAKVYASSEKALEAAAAKARAAFAIGDEITKVELIWGIRDGRGFTPVTKQPGSGRTNPEDGQSARDTLE